MVPHPRLHKHCRGLLDEQQKADSGRPLYTAVNTEHPVFEGQGAALFSVCIAIDAGGLFAAQAAGRTRETRSRRARRGATRAARKPGRRRRCRRTRRWRPSMRVPWTPDAPGC